MSEVNIYKGISEKRKQQMKEYNRKHREQCRIAQRKYYESHKEYYKSFNRNRFKEQQKEIEKLNNIINELKKKWLIERINNVPETMAEVYEDKIILEKIKKLRGEDK